LIGLFVRVFSATAGTHHSGGGSEVVYPQPSVLYGLSTGDEGELGKPVKKRNFLPRKNLLGLKVWNLRADIRF
jgi:hypothetical protein